jgi:hypothetical protein
MIMNGELLEILKHAITACSNVLSKHTSEVIKESQKNPNQNGW